MCGIEVRGQILSSTLTTEYTETRGKPRLAELPSTAAMTSARSERSVMCVWTKQNYSIALQAMTLMRTGIMILP